MNKDKIKENILINEDLFSENLNDYSKRDLRYIKIPNSVGIATDYDSNKKVYIIYLNDERGNIEWTKTSDNFVKSIINARRMYNGLYKKIKRCIYGFK